MMNTKKKIIILGTGAFAPVLAEMINSINGYMVAGFVENMDRQRCKQKIAGLEVYWYKQLSDFDGNYKAVCCLATTHRHKYIDQVKSYNIDFETIIHPSAVIMQSSTVGLGSIIGPGVIISSNTTIGEHVRINRAVTIGHDTEIGNFVTIQPGANIAGKCRIGPRSYIGMGANIIDGLSIGTGCLVGAGSLVLKDLSDRVMALGVPATVVKENIDGK
ncbi:MAG: NeuD/PglB/VioB family sugar acetyltransferase [Planctomycetota bacterium]|jgi:sugar O-acyltransferase (sialic acid O-acetyltransferase NeuD family)